MSRTVTPTCPLVHSAPGTGVPRMLGRKKWEHTRFRSVSMITWVRATPVLPRYFLWFRLCCREVEWVHFKSTSTTFCDPMSSWQGVQGTVNGEQFTEREEVKESGSRSSIVFLVNDGFCPRKNEVRDLSNNRRNTSRDPVTFGVGIS